MYTALVLYIPRNSANTIQRSEASKNESVFNLFIREYCEAHRERNIPPRPVETTGGAEVGIQDKLALISVQTRRTITQYRGYLEENNLLTIILGRNQVISSEFLIPSACTVH